MKKLIFYCAAILAVMAAVSCKEIKVNTDTQVKVEVNFEPASNTVVDYMLDGMSSEDGKVLQDSETGEVTVESVPEAPVEFEASVEENNKFNAGEEVELPKICDMTVKVPISKTFPSDDIFKALEAPYICITVKNEKGKSFKYTSIIKNEKTGKIAEVSADIHETEPEVNIFVSEDGKVMDESAKNPKAVAAAGFTGLFEGKPEELKITDAKIQKELPKSAMVTADASALTLDFSALSAFPLTVKNGVPFTWGWELEVTEKDIQDFLGVKAVEATLLVTHKLPLQMFLNLSEPEQIQAQCDRINPSLNETEVTQEVNVKATCEEGVTYFPKAVVLITATLKGNRATYTLSNAESTAIKIDVKRDENGKKMVKVVMK